MSAHRVLHVPCNSGKEVESYLYARTTSQASLKPHDGTADLVLEGGLALLVVHDADAGLSPGEDAAAVGPCGGGCCGGCCVVSSAGSEGHFDGCCCWVAYNFLSVWQVLFI